MPLRCARGSPRSAAADELSQPRLVTPQPHKPLCNASGQRLALRPSPRRRPPRRTPPVPAVTLAPPASPARAACLSPQPPEGQGARVPGCGDDGLREAHARQRSAGGGGHQGAASTQRRLQPPFGAARGAPRPPVCTPEATRYCWVFVFAGGHHDRAVLPGGGCAGAPAARGRDLRPRQPVVGHQGVPRPLPGQPGRGHEAHAPAVQVRAAGCDAGAGSGRAVEARGCSTAADQQREPAGCGPAPPACAQR